MMILIKKPCMEMTKELLYYENFRNAKVDKINIGCRRSFIRIIFVEFIHLILSGNWFLRNTFGSRF